MFDRGVSQSHVSNVTGTYVEVITTTVYSAGDLVFTQIKETAR